MFETKDEGERLQYKSGMVREPQNGKPRFDLLIPKDLPYNESLLYRAAMLMNRGAEKYSVRNWEKANSIEELERFKSAAFRHMMQIMSDEKDEDHLAAVFFNINAMIYLEWKLKQKTGEKMDISDNLKKKLKQEITTEWWDSTSYAIFCNLAQKLIEKGFTETEAFDFLQIAYSAVSTEFGG